MLFILYTGKRNPNCDSHFIVSMMVNVLNSVFFFFFPFLYVQIKFLFPGLNDDDLGEFSSCALVLLFKRFRFHIIKMVEFKQSVHIM